jgi:hypothetical protein
MTAQSISILIATDVMHNNNQCQQSNVCLKTGFLLSLMILLDKQRSGYDQWRYHAPTNHRKAIIQHHSFYQSVDGPEPIPKVAIMPLDDKIRSPKLVIIHLHELNYPILKGDMGIMESKTLQDRTSHKSVSQPCQRTHLQR